jgi:hypothetical protein
MPIFVLNSNRQNEKTYCVLTIKTVRQMKLVIFINIKENSKEYLSLNRTNNIDPKVMLSE